MNTDVFPGGSTVKRKIDLIVKLRLPESSKNEILCTVMKRRNRSGLFKHFTTLEFKLEDTNEEKNE